MPLPLLPMNTLEEIARATTHSAYGGLMLDSALVERESAMFNVAVGTATAVGASTDTATDI